MEPITAYANEFMTGHTYFLNCETKICYIDSGTDHEYTEDTSANSLWNDADPFDYHKHRILCGNIIKDVIDHWYKRRDDEKV